MSKRKKLNSWYDRQNDYIQIILMSALTYIFVAPFYGHFYLPWQEQRAKSQLEARMALRALESRQARERLEIEKKAERAAQEARQRLLELEQEEAAQQLLAKMKEEREKKEKKSLKDEEVIDTYYPFDIEQFFNEHLPPTPENDPHGLNDEFLWHEPWDD